MIYDYIGEKKVPIGVNEYVIMRYLFEHSIGASILLSVDKQTVARKEVVRRTKTRGFCTKVRDKRANNEGYTTGDPQIFMGRNDADDDDHDRG